MEKATFGSPATCWHVFNSAAKLAAVRMNIPSAASEDIELLTLNIE